MKNLLYGSGSHSTTSTHRITWESLSIPDIDDGVRVNIAPLQYAGLLAADMLAKKDVEKAIADCAQWRADQRRWAREGKLPNCGWWPEETARGERGTVVITGRSSAMLDGGMKT